MSNLYSYSGPVTRFGICVANKYSGYTVASSEKQARNNICQQFKKSNGLMPSAKVELPGKITLVERR